MEAAYSWATVAARSSGAARHRKLPGHADSETVAWLFRPLQQVWYATCIGTPFCWLLTMSSLGDIVHLHAAGKDYIILGSAAAVSEVLEQRTANSSDRLIGPMVRL